MAKLVFGLQQSLDGYVDHLEMGERHRSLDTCYHGRRFRRPAVNYPGAIISRHSFVPRISS